MQPPLTVPSWEEVPGLVPGFSARLPLAHGPGNGNPAPAIERLGIAPVPVLLPRQVHGTRIACIGGLPWVRSEADGLIAMAPGLAAGILTADCVPVLLLATRSRVGAAIHAGWRGTLAGIIKEAVTAVTAAAPTAAGGLRAAVGPAIGGCCYEVGPDLCAAFADRYGAELLADARTGTMPRPHLDLRRIIRAWLEAAGLRAAAIEILGPCTCCDSRYASYRRDGGGAGRQLSFIGWRAAR